ncbi:type III secretion system chaperone [Erwinia sp. HDF1-3R]|uniref:type III secretion system chaperone n=1 Tax=Erwinia sp. HDF1-3R TaxID=3141543 RepID=UPI0031F4C15A
MSATEQLNHLLEHYGRQHNSALTLKDGVCALVDRDNREAAVIELPPGSDSLIFHCKIEDLHEPCSERYLRTLMSLNFEMNAMRGCWLALDNEESLRLCSQLSVSGLDATGFRMALSGFMTQAREVNEFITSLREAA